MPLPPCLATAPVATNTPTDRHDREHQKCEHEQAEDDPERRVGGWSEAEWSHRPRRLEPALGRLSQGAVMVVS